MRSIQRADIYNQYDDEVLAYHLVSCEKNIGRESEQNKSYLLCFVRMTTNNLYHYIKTWAFLHDLKANIDLVLWEHIPDVAQLPDTTTTHMSLADIWYDMSPTGDGVLLLAKNPRVLIILDTLTSTTISPLLAALPVTCSVTIINLGAWITGIINKHTVDNDDIALVRPYMHVFEPIDARHFLHILQKDETAYVRIIHDEVPDALFDENHQDLYQQTLISLQEFGYTWTKATVVTTPALLSRVSQAIQYMQTSQWRSYDLFVLTQIDAEPSNALLESVEYTGVLCVIHDQVNNLAFQHRVHTMITTKVQDVVVSYKVPNYKTLTTILPAYIYQQTDMESEHIAHYLISLG